MKKMLSIAFSVMLLAYAEPGHARDMWDEYQEFLQQFYFLDDQDFEQITCQVVVSTLNMEELRAQLRPVGRNISIVENMDDFKLIFGKKGGLSFNVPTFDIEIISEEGIADKKKVETGLSMIRNGIRKQLDGITEMLKGVFDEYTSPKKGKVEIKEIWKDGDKTKIRYVKEGKAVTSIWEGKTCKSWLVGPGVQMESEEEYEQVGTKLRVKRGNGSLTQGSIITNIGMESDYQYVGGVMLPSQILVEYSMIMPTGKQEAHFAIAL